MGHGRSGVVGRSLRKVALVALFILAVLASPVALPIRMLIARRQRPTQMTEQVVRTTRANPTPPSAV